MADVVLDAGVLIALEREAGSVRAVVEGATDRGATLLVAGATLAEVWRGGAGRGVPLARALKTLRIVDTTEAIGKHAGELIAEPGRSGRRLALDAIVVATAEAREAEVLTCDPGDLMPLGDRAGVPVLPLAGR